MIGQPVVFKAFGGFAAVMTVVDEDRRYLYVTDSDGFRRLGIAKTLAYCWDGQVKGGTVPDWATLSRWPCNKEYNTL